jgi:hypothetical protein
MMITKIQLAAMSRVNIPEEERRDFYLYVDEFQNFATNSFANILSEARKYRLNLIMGHQYIEQLSEEVKAAVFGNVGTLAVFRVGATDAEELVKEFAPIFTEEDLVNLPKYNIVLKLMIDGVASDPFSARGLPPLKPEELTGNEEAVINNTRSHYANARAEVEAKIMRWHTEDDAQTIKATPVAAASRPPVAVAAQQALPLKPEELTGNEEAVINNTRTHYANARAEVEAKIMRWHTEDDAQTIKATPVAAASRPPVAVAAQQALATPNYPPSLSTAPVGHIVILKDQGPGDLGGKYHQVPSNIES